MRSGKEGEGPLRRAREGSAIASQVSVIPMRSDASSERASATPPAGHLQPSEVVDGGDAIAESRATSAPPSLRPPPPAPPSPPPCVSSALTHPSSTPPPSLKIVAPRSCAARASPSVRERQQDRAMAMLAAH